MKKDIKVPLLFLAPALVLMLIFMILPIFVSFYLSLTDFNVFALVDWSKAKFIGLENYRKLLNDELFWKALKNTLYFVAIGVPCAIIFSLSFAILLNRPDIIGRNLFRVGFYLPHITTTVAIAVVWKWVLNPRYGILNWALSLFGITGPSWLGDPRWAMPAIIMLVVWKGLGYNIIIFLAGLQNIPEHLYEAAQIDGANRWQQLFHITIPLLRPTTFFVTVMTLIGYLQLFAEPYMLTDGGPLNSTLSIVLYMYRQGFKFFNLGYASAIAYVLFGIIFVATLIQMKFRDEEIQY
ncbi:sugar ABC transporter permease [Anoxybacter fermentans]|uniref:Sugar ABC transporter permease n=1 Tax=Anoxybacter fermentans TaxID=1323375 RepID=A0A3Q9HQZ4_9FIRM|nr:sugar ABC transporter permease [Anoxybacter fermentans]AZR73762.1 sugar ABC transporter permease [Anoxybacter fermentans]